MEKKLVKIIKDWVGKNFGIQEIEDPSWNIEALAHEIAKHQHELYWEQELAYLEEDVERYASDEGYDLTPQEIFMVADRIRNSEWYCSLEPECVQYEIKRAISLREDKDED